MRSLCALLVKFALVFVDLVYHLVRRRLPVQFFRRGAEDVGVVIIRSKDIGGTGHPDVYAGASPAILLLGEQQGHLRVRRVYGPYMLVVGTPFLLVEHFEGLKMVQGF